MFDFITIGTIILSVVKGHPRTMLKEPHGIILSEAVAHKYFGDLDPMNKGLLLDNVFLGKIKHDFKVTGVFKAFPGNSHMYPDIPLSISTLTDLVICGVSGHLGDIQKRSDKSVFYYLLRKAIP